MSKDYYKVLELDRQADHEAIKKAYRRLALKYHPDRNPGNEKEAEERFREIHEAYAVLSDPQKKAEFDTNGVNGVRNTPAYQDSADLFNMFNSFFGRSPFSNRTTFFSPPRSAFGGNNFRSNGFQDFSFPANFRPPPFEGFENRGSFTSRQEKVKMTVNVGFRDSVLGCSRQITLEFDVKCSVCSGTGASSGRVHDTICNICGGAGRIRDPRSGMAMTCAECSGRGRKTETSCPACLGAGKIPKVHEEELVVPPGVSPKSTMQRVIAPDDNEEEIYEVTIEFNVETHPFFKRVGSDVHLDVPITYTQAVLGDTIQVPCIYGGTTEVQIPPGSQPMGEFILIGQGFFNLDGNGQGDMVVRWILEVPRVLSTDERKIIAQLAQLEQGSLPEKRVQFLQFLIDWDAESSS